jgi:hypothetical protein
MSEKTENRISYLNDYELALIILIRDKKFYGMERAGQLIIHHNREGKPVSLETKEIYS